MTWWGALWAYPVWDLLSFLNLEVHVSCQVWEVLNYFLSTFSAYLLLSLLRLQWQECTIFCYSPTGLWDDSFFSIQSIFSLLFRLGDFRCSVLGFPGGSDGKASTCNAGDLGSIPGLGRSPGEGNGNPLQHSCLENPMDGGAWQATIHGAAKSRTQLSDFIIFQLVNSCPFHSAAESIY